MTKKICPEDWEQVTLDTVTLNEFKLNDLKQVDNIKSSVFLQITRIPLITDRNFKLGQRGLMHYLFKHTINDQHSEVTVEGRRR
jgi:hypothetical protein